MHWNFKLYLLLIVVPVLTSNCQEVSSNNAGDSAFIEIQVSPKLEGKDSLTISEFFKLLADSHYSIYSKVYPKRYQQFISSNDIQENDRIKQIFGRIEILHELLTAKSAANCSKGSVLNIPYFWHWITPNPRYDIIDNNSGIKLQKTNAPPPFNRYASFADIDRTPSLFLTDLVSETPRYSGSCDTFYSFGWCSEREMAFTAFCDAWDLEAKVIAKNNHSWSEIVLGLEDINRETIYILIKVDNTFDQISWQKISAEEKEEWMSYKSPHKTAAWYNNTAHKDSEIKILTSLIVPPKSVKRIENALIQYINEN